jgi:hypothetical protein
MVMSGKKKFKSGKLNAVTEGILIDALKLWQQEFIGEIRKMEADGKRVMFHPNWTAVMLYEFGLSLVWMNCQSTSLLKNRYRTV